MTASPHDLEHLLERHLAGEPVDIPESLTAEFQQALAAHAALHDLLQGTIIGDMDSEPQRSPPELPPDYVIERELGHGGMGVVYLARQQSLNREVAIKVLRPSHQTFHNLVDRFLHEAQHLARLRHPRIVTIYEIGNSGGEPYFTMDYVNGEPLTLLLSRGALPPTQAVDLIKQVASAVQHAHRNGIIHRDLKPGNILIDQQGRAYVSDFGLARQLHQDSTLTRSGELLGTPQYMAPEQARGQGHLIGEATDIHALGLLLYEMLTGKPAFQAQAPADVLVKLLNHEPASPRKIDHRIPRDLETICLKCLQKDPTQRYANVGALLEDIRRFEAGEPLTARRPGWVTVTFKWCRRHWKLALTALLAAALSLIIASQLFDRSYEDLVAWGDEELATGNAQIAAQVYSRAWDKGTPAQQRLLIDRIVQTCRISEDPSSAVAMALKVIELNPEVSFGELDFLVAQALVTRERANSPQGAIDVWHAHPHPSLELIRQRLELALEHGVPDDRRLETEETLATVKLILAEGRPNVRYAPDFLHQLPTGTRQELQATIDDEAQPAWNRAKAAIASGRQLEKQGQHSDAIRYYETAVQLLQTVYPYYSGVRSFTGNKDSNDAEECQLVAELLADLKRLDPAGHPFPKGGIEFSLEGVPVPDDVSMSLRVELTDPSVTNPDQGLSHQLPRLVRVQNSQNTTVGVMDGRYRLASHGYQAQWEAGSADFMKLVQVDTSHWPTEVTIAGDILKLPPARIRLAEEITLQSPANGASVNLDEAELRWRPVPNAAYYRVNLEYTMESPHPTYAMFAAIRTDSARLSFSKLEGPDKQAIRKNLLQGRTGGWNVNAYDQDDRRIGVTLHDHRFLVAQPLSPE